MARPNRLPAAKDIEIAKDADSNRLGFNRLGGGCCVPARPYYVRLPSGMRHWYETEEDARRSQYWPHSY